MRLRSPTTGYTLSSSPSRVSRIILLVLKRTRLGLDIRAVSQNRAMARAMGIRSEWVDAMTFGLGSGIAGVAGVALSQLTNVGPNLGQSYIIDSFMVVVFGGVGNLWGSLIGGMSLGIVNKLAGTLFWSSTGQNFRTRCADPFYPGRAPRACSRRPAVRRRTHSDAADTSQLITSRRTDRGSLGSCRRARRWSIVVARSSIKSCPRHLRFTSRPMD